MRSRLRALVQELRRDEVGASLVRGASGSFVAKVAGAAITVGVQVLLARVLGVADYGVYSYVLTWLVVLSAVGRIGLDFTVLRFAAAYHGQREWGLLHGVLGAAGRWALFASVALAALLATFVLALRSHMDGELYHAFLVGCGALPLMTLLAIKQASLRALQHVVITVAAEFAVLPLALATLVVAAYYLYPTDLGGTEAVFLHAGASATMLVMLMAWLARVMPPQAVRAAPVERLREWMHVALPLFLWTGLAFLNAQTDMLMIGALRGTDDAGLYQASVRLGGLALWGLFAVNAAAGPMIARLHAQGKKRELQRLVSLSAIGIAAFTIPVAVAMIAAGPWLLELFGTPYRAAYSALVLLVLGHCANAFTGPVGYLLMMTGHEREAAGVMGAAALLNLGLNALLVPKLGLSGAAIGTVASTVFWNAVLYARVRKHLGVEPTILSLVRPGNATAEGGPS